LAVTYVAAADSRILGLATGEGVGNETHGGYTWPMRLARRTDTLRCTA
jgi:hypothetical protein